MEGLIKRLPFSRTPHPSRPGPFPFLTRPPQAPLHLGLGVVSAAPRRRNWMVGLGRDCAHAVRHPALECCVVNLLGTLIYWLISLQEMQLTDDSFLPRHAYLL